MAATLNPLMPAPPSAGVVSEGTSEVSVASSVAVGVLVVMVPLVKAVVVVMSAVSVSVSITEVSVSVLLSVVVVTALEVVSVAVGPASPPGQTERSPARAAGGETLEKMTI